MRKHWRMVVLSGACGLVLAACGGDDHGGGAQSAPSNGSAFEAYAQQEVELSTCDNTEPMPIDVNFSFNPDQDMADPRDLSKFSLGCRQ